MDEVGSMLRKEGVLTESSFKSIEHFKRKWSLDTFAAVLECSLITEENIADILSKELRLDRIYHLNESTVELECLKFFPYSLARKFDCVPLRFLGEKKDIVEIAIANPTNTYAARELAATLKREVVLVVAELRKIRSLVELIYPLDEQILELKKSGASDDR